MTKIQSKIAQCFTTEEWLSLCTHEAFLRTLHDVDSADMAEVCVFHGRQILDVEAKQARLYGERYGWGKLGKNKAQLEATLEVVEKKLAHLERRAAKAPEHGKHVIPKLRSEIAAIKEDLQFLIIKQSAQ